MSGWSWTRAARRRIGGLRLACGLCAAGALLSATACSSSSNDAPPITSFPLDECHGSFVVLARFPETLAPSGLTGLGVGNNLALDGDTLYMTYASSVTNGPLPISGGIVAVSVSGSSIRVVGAADTAKTASWSVDNFWISGGQVHLQTGTEILSVPADPSTPTVLPLMLIGMQTAEYRAFTEDADFGYAAQGDDARGVQVTKTPIAGGAPITLVDESLPGVSLGGIADTGDALLLQVSWRSPTDLSGQVSTRVWRIPKDGTPRSDARPDVVWADPLVWPQWLAWDGENILAPISVQQYLVQARVASAGTSSPQYLRLNGTVATRRGDEILSFQTIEAQPPSGTWRLLVASSKGAPAGSVVACGPEVLIGDSAPGGIAASDTDIYVSYKDGHDTVIARVSQ